MTCKSCGGNISSNEKFCKFCGASNPNYLEESKQKSDNFPIKTENKIIEVPEKMNVAVFIILLIVFWPAAIIYLLVNESKKK